jgi:predicted metal-dependent phosphoesterase TrpH
MRIDLHLHTRHSFDCLSDPEAVLARARALGLDAIGVTDHNEIAGALALQRAYPDRVIVGEEVKTAEKVDVIGLFLRERIPKGTPALETCRLIHEQGGLVYVPHPFAGGKGGGGRILAEIEGEIDLLEGFNARLHDARLNDRAVAWAAERGVPVGAGSDAHTIAEVGRGFVEIPDCALEPAAFLAAMRHAVLHGTMSSRAVHLASTFAKIRKRIGGG